MGLNTKYSTPKRKKIDKMKQKEDGPSGVHIVQ